MEKRARAVGGLLLCTAITLRGALLGVYDFTATAAASSVGANISSFSVFNDDTVGGGITGSVVTSSPGYFHTSAGWDTSFTRYVQFTVTPASLYYLAADSVAVNVRQNDFNSVSIVRMQIFSGATLIQAVSATLPPGSSTGPFIPLTFTFDPANFNAAQAGPLRFRITTAVNDNGNNFFDFDSVTLNGTVNPVPEPVSQALALFALGALGFTALRSRFRRAPRH